MLSKHESKQRGISLSFGSPRLYRYRYNFGIAMKEIQELLKDNDNKIVYLILRLEEKVNDLYWDVNKVLSLSKITSLQTEQEKEKLVELFSKIFELKCSINKLACP